MIATDPVAAPVTEVPVVKAGASVSGARSRRQPVRTCVACRTTGGKRGLLRVVRLPEGKDAAGGGPTVAIDPTGKRSGRGAYVCPTPECVATALKRKALERSLKVTITEDVAEGLRVAVAGSGGGDAPSARKQSAKDSDVSEGETPPGT